MADSFDELCRTFWEQRRQTIRSMFAAAVDDFFSAVGLYLLKHQTHLLQGSARAKSHALAPFKQKSSDTVLRNGMLIMSGGEKVTTEKMVQFCQAINGKVSLEGRWQRMISQCRVRFSGGRECRAAALDACLDTTSSHVPFFSSS